MAEAILVPQVGQDLTEATIVELHVQLGDTVKMGDLVAVVESEKASFEVEAFAEGTVISLPYKTGDLAPVLEPLMHLGAPGETVETPIDAADERTDSSVASAPAAVAEAATDLADHGSAIYQSGALRASPVARRTATQRGVDLARVRGSGPAGAVVLKDIMAAVSSGAASGSGSTPLEVRTLKDGQGTPLVLIHGFGADLSSWRLLAAALDVPQPIMALDLPGHGASMAADAGSFDQIVEATASALQSVDGMAHLVGHSLGGAIAIALAERADLDIRSLTLLSPGGLCPSVNGDFVEGFLAARSEAALTAWMQRLVHDPAKLAPVLVRATLEARKVEGLVAAQTRIARVVFERSTQLYSVADALARYRGPCAVIAGSQDGIIPMADIERNLPANVALHRVLGVGHLPQIEATELVETIIARTMRSAG